MSLIGAHSHEISVDKDIWSVYKVIFEDMATSNTENNDLFSLTSYMYIKCQNKIDASLGSLNQYIINNVIINYTADTYINASIYNELVRCKNEKNKQNQLIKDSKGSADKILPFFHGPFDFEYRKEKMTANNIQTVKIQEIGLEVMTEDLGELRLNNRMMWDEAKKACVGLGYGWRLPTIDELKKLYEFKDKLGSLHGSYWSSTKTDSGAWEFNLSNGYVFNGSTGNFCYVRAVRNLK